MQAITIYGSPNCSFCEKAKQFCEDQRYPATYRDVREIQVRSELLGKLPVPPKTVPVIFVGQIEIAGGYTGLLKAHATGALQQIIGGQ